MPKRSKTNRLRRAPRPEETTAAPVPGDRRWLNLLPLLIVAAGMAAYWTSFSGAFVFDDRKTILENERIRQLWPLTEVLGGRRPLVDLSLAINYTLGDLEVWGYHAVNLGIHVLAALTLFGIVRRTLRAGGFAEGAAGSWPALAVALIWVVHPLQTQSVTYLTQRGESLMGLFFLLTVYGLIRAVGSSRGRRWYFLTVLVCACGMASKAVMVTAPVVALLYDRVFLARSFREVFRSRGGLYSALATTWVVLAVCGILQSVLAASPEQTVTVGFGYRGVTPVGYLLTQPGVILHYLRLSFWPSSLCLDYGWPVAVRALEIVPQAVVALILLGLTVGAFRWCPWAGFSGAWFFLILSPTSSFVPLKDLLFEHRMYLPLAGVIVLVVFGGRVFLRAVFRRLRFAVVVRRLVSVAVVVAVVTSLSYVTSQRNQTYRSRVSLWRDAAAKRPEQSRVHYNLANALYAEGEADEAITEYREALRLNPAHSRAYVGLGVALARQGKLNEAVREYRKALDINPAYVDAGYNMANALARQGRSEEAIDAYRKILLTDPHHVHTHCNLGLELANLGFYSEAVLEYRAALHLNPDSVEPLVNLGIALIRQVKHEEAIEPLRRAVLLQPTLAPAHYYLGEALAGQGRIDEAIRAYREALRWQQDYPAAQEALETALARADD